MCKRYSRARIGAVNVIGLDNEVKDNLKMDPIELVPMAANPNSVVTTSRGTELYNDQGGETTDTENVWVQSKSSTIRCNCTCDYLNVQRI